MNPRLCYDSENPGETKRSKGIRVVSAIMASQSPTFNLARLSTAAKSYRESAGKSKWLTIPV
jgi:hypothetical protein